MAWQNERTVPDALQAIVGNVQEIFRSEVRLAQTELKEKAVKAGKATAILGAGIVLGIYALGFLLLTMMFALSAAIPAWAAALCVCVLAGIIAAVCVSAGRKELKRVSPKPERTIETMKENVEWVKRRAK
ncbi:MAG: phage holin family protein [Acidobacteria bacterium]|nr:phage holin family protein [Acidobacteriota bacterium]